MKLRARLTRDLFGMRRRLVIVGAALALLVLGPPGWVLYSPVYSRIAFGTWNPMDQPTRIDYCGRRYLPGSHVNGARIDAEGNDFGTFPVRQVGTAPSGAPIFAKPLPDSVRHKFPNGPPLPCAMDVYLKVARDDYVAYVISGGP